MRREKSVEIKAPPEKVWEMLALDRMPEWMGDWKDIAFASEVRTSQDKYRVGTSAYVTETHAKYDLQIIESLENEKIMYRSKGPAWGKVTMTLTYTLKPAEAGTEVTYEASYEGGVTSVHIARNSIALGLLDLGTHGAIEKSLNNMKAILERTRADDEVMQFLAAGEKVILCDSVYIGGFSQGKLVLTDRRLFLCGTKGFWHLRYVLKKKINLHNIVRVFGDSGKPRLVIISKVGEEWRWEFALDSVYEWNYNKAQSMSMARVSSWVDAINLELSKSLKNSK